MNSTRAGQRAQNAEMNSSDTDSDFNFNSDAENPASIKRTIKRTTTGQKHLALKHKKSIKRTKTTAEQTAQELQYPRRSRKLLSFDDVDRLVFWIFIFSYYPARAFIQNH